MKEKCTCNYSNTRRAFLIFVLVLFCPVFPVLPEETGPGVIGNSEISSQSIDQVKSIEGRVVDQDGFPMPGVSIMVKGKEGIGTVTDQEGKYLLSCNENDILVFSFIGFRLLEKRAGEIDRITLTLYEDVEELDEVVVVAFGKQKKESLVSSISTVSPKELTVPSSNLTTAFAGRMASIIARDRESPGSTMRNSLSGESPASVPGGKKIRSS